MADTSKTGDEIAPVQRTQAPAPNELGEKAAEFLAAHTDGNVDFTYEEEKGVVKRINRRVLVLLLWAYFFQQLDKSSLSYVSIFGLTEDANLVGKQYSWLGSILYLAQLVMQPLAAFILVKFPTGKVMAAAIFLWGSSQAIMSACTDFPSLLGMRFALGAFEAMIAPSCVAVTQRADARNLIVECHERCHLHRRQSRYLRSGSHRERCPVQVPDHLHVLRSSDRSLRLRRPLADAGLPHGGQVPHGTREVHRRRKTEGQPDGLCFEEVALGPRLGDAAGSEDMVLVHQHHRHLVSIVQV
jgi:hypothetical protein